MQPQPSTTDDPASGQAETVSTAAEDSMRIEQVAARTGLTKRTLRYYEEIGLLPPPTRTEGGYRLYTPDDVAHLERIKRLRDLLGFSLAEIRELAEAEEERQQVRAAWERETDPHARLTWLDRAEELTKRQLTLVEEKLVGLQEMQTNLRARLQRYDAYRATTRDELPQER